MGKDPDEWQRRPSSQALLARCCAALRVLPLTLSDAAELTMSPRPAAFSAFILALLISGMFLQSDCRCTVGAPRVAPFPDTECCILWLLGLLFDPHCSVCHSLYPFFEIREH